jgi:ankyrin repeat protein
MKRASGLLLGVALFLFPQTVTASGEDIFNAIERGDCCKVRFLIQIEPRMMDTKSVNGIRPLHLAAGMGDLQIVTILLNNGVSVNAQCFNQTTALMRAAEAGELAVVRLLNIPGLEINVRDKRGWTALHYAACCGSCEILQFLMERGADINGRTNNGTTPLSMAVVNNHQDAADLIRAYGGIE